jgi:hypothetical protein
MPILCRIFGRAATELPPHLPGGGPHRRLRRTPREALKASGERATLWTAGPAAVWLVRACSSADVISVTTSRASARRTVECAHHWRAASPRGQGGRTSLAPSVRHRGVGPSRARGGDPEELAVPNAGIGCPRSRQRTVVVSSRGRGRSPVWRCDSAAGGCSAAGLERAGCGSHAVPRCGAISTTGGSAARSPVATASAP